MLDERLENIVEDFDNEISHLHSSIDISKMVVKYGMHNHPYIAFKIGEKFLLANEKEDAEFYLVKACSYGVDPSNKFLNEGYAYSIGQSIYYYIKFYKFDSSFDTYKYNLFCIGYIAQSMCIHSIGTEAYDSLKTRALMIDDFDEKIVNRFLSKYGSTDLTKEIISYADFFDGSIGYRNVGQFEQSENLSNWAEENRQEILSIPKYQVLNRVGKEMVVQLSKESQSKLVNNLISDYQKNTFKMDSADFRAKARESRIKPRGFFN